MVAGIERLRRGLGRLAAPKEIRQEPYDRDDAHLRRLCRLRPTDMPQPDDLWAYGQDLRYAHELQTDLLLWVLPYCLRAWRDELRGDDRRYGGFVEHLYPALADRVVGSLNERQRAAVATYMRDALLEEIDDQRGLAFSGMDARPYRWIRAQTSYGVIFPDVGELWAAWWGLGSRGRAVAAVQYLSCLVYDDTENPVFARWTPHGGGGPPCLWEFDGHLYTHRWLESNVQFLADALEPSKVTDVLGRAVSSLNAEPEADVGTRVLAGVADRTTVLASRCEELPRLLRQVQKPEAAWSL
jgi:hypothetical protein